MYVGSRTEVAFQDSEGSSQRLFIERLLVMHLPLLRMPSSQKPSDVRYMQDLALQSGDDFDGL